MENKYRLPDSILPNYYSITIEPDLNNEKFNGHETISLTIKETTKSIKLNSIGLTISTAKILGLQLESVDILEDQEHETISINFNQDLTPGDYELELFFFGNLDNSLRGFYLSRYTDDNGIEHKIGTTQFESTDARRAFPCFDEPEFKSIFSITLKVPKGLFTVSNTGIKNITKTDSHDIYEFKDSIKMSTYLVAFVIGPFEATEEVIVDGVPLRIVHAIGKSHLTDFAIETGKFALEYFSDYFGRPYPGDKLDMIAIPDFASGAMENLGCITYREALLLVNEDEATQSELTRIADVVMHEIAHMWFGDLVTMKWWNGIWLNEAFATFMATKAVDKFNKEWERWVQFGLEKSAAFDVDSLHSTRPIEYEVISPDDASAMFDLLTYEKGGAVLRMLEQYVGEEKFRDGIRHYLNKHEFANTETEDLWRSIESYSTIPVRETMNSWILQAGYPRINFEIKNESVKISQSVFKYDNKDNGAIWKIPIEIKLSDNGEIKTKKILLEDQEIQINIASSKFITGNCNSNGFYRSNYSKTFLSDIDDDHLSKLNKFEKFSLIDDLWASTVSCKTDISEFYKLASKLNDDTDPDLQSLIVSTLSVSKKYLNGENKGKYLKFVEDYLRKLINLIANEESKSENLKTKELRSILYRGLGITCESKEYLHKSSKIFEIYNGDRSKVDPNLAAAAIAVLASNGNEDLYEDFLKRHINAKTPQDKLRFLFSLTEFKDEKLLHKTLKSSISKTIKNQDAPYLIASALRNYIHTNKTWSFIENNWNEINDKFPNNSIPRIFGGVRSISDKNLAIKVKDFFSKNPIPQGQKTIDQNLEKMFINIKFVEYQKIHLDNWINKEL